MMIPAHQAKLTIGTSNGVRTILTLCRNTDSNGDRAFCVRVQSRYNVGFGLSALEYAIDITDTPWLAESDIEMIRRLVREYHFNYVSYSHGNVTVKEIPDHAWDKLWHLSVLHHALTPQRKPRNKNGRRRPIITTQWGEVN